MLHASAVRSKFAEVVADALPVREFDLWLSDAAWDAHRNAGPVARELLDEAQILVLDYYSSSDPSRLKALVSGLAALVNNIVVSEPVEITPEQQLYFSYLQMSSLVPSQASALAAA
jgi:hypothetical protein